MESQEYKPSTDTLRWEAIEVLKSVFDPEIPVNIYDLGMIYEIIPREDGHLRVVMTLTSPTCPVAESLPIEVKEKLSAIPGVTDVDLELTFDPPWGHGMITERGRKFLNER